MYLKLPLTLPLLVTAFAASAQTFVLSPVDARTDYNAYNINGDGHRYSAQGVLEAGAILVGDQHEEYVEWAAEFDLAGLGTATSLVSATFSARAYGSGNPGPIYDQIFHDYAGTGNVEDRYSVQAQDVWRVRLGQAHQGARIDATAFVRGLLAQGQGHAGFYVSSLTDTTWYSTGEDAPTLTLTFAPVPEPSCAIALGLGAVGLLRRRKQA